MPSRNGLDYLSVLRFNGRAARKSDHHESRQVAQRAGDGLLRRTSPCRAISSWAETTGEIEVSPAPVVRIATSSSSSTPFSHVPSLSSSEVFHPLWAGGTNVVGRTGVNILKRDNIVYTVLMRSPLRFRPLFSYTIPGISDHLIELTRGGAR